MSESNSVMSNSAAPWTVVSQSPLSMKFSRKNTRMGSHSLLQGIFLTQGSNPDLPTFHADSLPAEPPGKPKNKGTGSVSLLQQIFSTQESN